MQANVRGGDVPDLIRKTAEEFCGVFYDGPRTAKFRHIGVSQKAFVRRHWGEYVPQAVEVLSSMLGMEGVPDNQKTEIYDALISLQMLLREGKNDLSLGRWK